MNSIFKCPSCDSKIEIDNSAGESICGTCSFKVKSVEQIPLLVKNYNEINGMIEDMKKGARAEWYETSQMIQWTGPYRHHYRKRKFLVENILKNYKEKMNKPLTGLDLGCGDGGNIEWLSKYFDKMYGSDYNIIRLARAKSTYKNIELFMADATNYPIMDNTIDVVYFNHVLEHIKEDEKALKEVYRILKPGGILVLGIPNEGVAFWKLAYKLQPKFVVSSDHVQFYTAESIAEKCRNVGFNIDNVHHIGWGIPHWTLDAIVRQFKVMDDLLEVLGKVFFRAQASSLYVVLSK